MYLHEWVRAIDNQYVNICILWDVHRIHGVHDAPKTCMDTHSNRIGIELEVQTRPFRLPDYERRLSLKSRRDNWGMWPFGHAIFEILSLFNLQYKLWNEFI